MIGLISMSSTRILDVDPQSRQGRSTVVQIYILYFAFESPSRFLDIDLQVGSGPSSVDETLLEHISEGPSICSSIDLEASQGPTFEEISRDRVQCLSWSRCWSCQLCTLYFVVSLVTYIKQTFSP